MWSMPGPVCRPRRASLAELLGLLTKRFAAIHGDDAQSAAVGKLDGFVADLHGQFARRHQAPATAGRSWSCFGIKPFQDRNRERRRHPALVPVRICPMASALPLQRQRDPVGLHRSGVHVARFGQGGEHWLRGGPVFAECRRAGPRWNRRRQPDEGLGRPSGWGLWKWPDGAAAFGCFGAGGCLASPAAPVLTSPGPGWWLWLRSGRFSGGWPSGGRRFRPRLSGTRRCRCVSRRRRAFDELPGADRPLGGCFGGCVGLGGAAAFCDSPPVSTLELVSAAGLAELLWLGCLALRLLRPPAAADPASELARFRRLRWLPGLCRRTPAVSCTGPGARPALVQAYAGSRDLRPGRGRAGSTGSADSSGRHGGRHVTRWSRRRLGSSRSLRSRIV